MYSVDKRKLSELSRKLNEMGAVFTWKRELLGDKVTVVLGNMPVRTYGLANKILVDNSR